MGIRVLTQEIGSRTVFWEELGLPSRGRMSKILVDHLATMWDQEIEPWCRANTCHDWNSHEAGVWFADRRDAIMFLLTWNNRLT